VLAKVPLPEYTPGIVAWPVIVKPVAPSVAVPVSVNVLLTLAACAPAPTSSAKTKVENVRFIVY
jgi:predicted TIM-barrel enzyme